MGSLAGHRSPTPATVLADGMSKSGLRLPSLQHGRASLCCPAHPCWPARQPPCQGGESRWVLDQVSGSSNCMLGRRGRELEKARRDPTLQIYHVNVLLLLWVIVFGNCTERRQDLPVLLLLPWGYFTPHALSSKHGQYNHHSFLSGAHPVSLGTCSGMWWKMANGSDRGPRKTQHDAQHLGQPLGLRSWSCHGL